MTALGDSISVAFDASTFLDNLSLSWSTGDDSSGTVNSHYVRLKNGYALTHLSADNLAVAGAKAADLAAQAAPALAKKPDYVTIMIGANDVCSWSDSFAADAATFGGVVQQTVKSLIAAQPTVKIVLMPIPDMLHLYAVGAPQAGCQAIWNSYGLCEPLFGTDRTDAERQAFAGRVTAANAALQGIQAANAANVVYVSAVATYQFTAGDISSIDCFHPSAAGQGLLADLAWKGGWFKSP